MKNYLTKLALVAVVGIAGSGLVAADEFDKKTVITINEAVQLPTTTLPAGTYVIKLLRSPDVNRNTVQIFDKDEKHIITTILAIPNQRIHPNGKSVFAFWEVPAGQPKALRAWFYPGDEFGQEFAYPKAEATTIMASNAGATVPVNDENTAAASDTTTVATAEPAPAPAPVATPEPEPAPAPVEVAAAPQEPPAPVATREEPVSQAPAAIDSDAQRVNPAPAESLPKTASNLPLFGLIGMLSIICAFALKLAYFRS
jgi:hypothetical protein